MKKSFTAVFLFIGLVLQQAASCHEAELSKRIDVLEKEINNIQKSVSNFIDNQKGTSQGKNISTKAIEDLTAEIKNLQLDIERIELKVNKYSGQNQSFEIATNNKISELRKSLNKGESGTQSKDNYLISNISKEIESSDQFSDRSTNKINENKAAAEYQKAYVLLKQSGVDKQAQDKAIDAFTNFIDKFQDSPLQGNAYYWIGSIHDQQKQYKKSAIDFLNGYKANPKSGRAIDNLLGLSSSLIKLNKTKEACSALNKLYGEFPNMNITNKRHTDEMFNNAGCSNDN
jgi:tol-pal system protein YbgF